MTENILPTFTSVCEAIDNAFGNSIFQKMKIKFLFGLILSLLLKVAVADINSTTWTSNSQSINPATGTLVVGSLTANVSLAYGSYLNAGQQFAANWTAIAGNLGSINPQIGMAIGYNKTATTQTLSFDIPVTNPYLMFNYVDPMTVDFSSVGAANVRLVNTTSSGSGTGGLAALSNGIVTVQGRNTATDGFVVQLIGTFSSPISFVTTLASAATSSIESAGFAVAVDSPLATIGGAVSGLAASQSVVLQNNAGNNTTVSSNGVFSFSTPISTGTAYAVTVLTQPSGQTCTVGNASGTANGNVTNVAVTCTTNTYTVGGTVTGLAAGQSVVLLNNGGNSTTVNSNNFTFSTAVNSGGAYAVTVGTQPTGQTCTVTNGSGTASANVTNVTVTCTANPAQPIPTLGEWAMIFMASLMAMLGIRRMRRSK